MVFESLWFQFDPEQGFDYDKFIKVATPKVQACIVPDGKLGPEQEPGEHIISIEYTDYTPEIEKMFERMGINELDGEKNFFFRKDMTYIQVITKWQTRDRHNQVKTNYGTFSFDLSGEIVIFPRGLHIITN